MTCVLILMKSKNIMPHISTLAFPLESKATRHITLSLCCIIFSSTAVFDTLGLHGLQHAILPVLHYLQSLPRFMSIAPVMPSSHLILWCPLLLSIFPSIRDFSNELAVRIRWPKYWSFMFSISPSNEYPGLISLRLTGLISFLSKESSLVPQFEGINSLVLYLLYSPALTAIRDHWEDHSFDYSRALN